MRNASRKKNFSASAKLPTHDAKLLRSRFGKAR